MKSMLRVVSLLLIGATVSCFAQDRKSLEAELEKIKAELKPLRQEAYLDKDVIAARKALDNAYRKYTDAVRAAIVRRDPSKKTLVAREIAIRKQLTPGSSGSRAEDYERKAAHQTSADTN
jgi:hypothetical protein